MRLAERSRLVIIGFVATLILAWPSLPAQAAPYAAMVMDMRDGTVLHSRSADRRQHPASLTKMMTLYLTFEAVESGRLRLDQQVKVSRHAARQPASKLYLKTGQRVSIRHLIRATAIKSANDAAMVLAETIGGSQSGFARMMTDKARQLGMTNSTFKNPHGLTASGHLSTARDMAHLARRLYFDFPQYYNVFGRVSATAAGKRIRTTNRLLVSYKGAEGMKTGYTRAAGYNLVSVASRGSKRVIAVVMGGKSSRTRNKRVAELLDLGFAKAGTRVATVRPKAAARTRAAVAEAPMPPTRPAMRATGLAAIGEALGGSQAVAAVVPASSYAPLATILPPRRPNRLAAATPTLLPGGRGVPPARPSWTVQLGAFEDKARAVESVTAASMGGVAILASASSEITEIRSDRGTPLYAVRFTGLGQREASKACRALKSHGRDCVTLAPR